MSKQRIRVNREIRIPEIRLIDSDGKQLGLFLTAKALELAETQGLDLVELSPTAKPPVCKIMDFGKYKYEQTKKIKEARKHQVIITVKEVKFRPNIDTHDIDFKVRNILGFLDEGNKVKITVVYRGREMAHRELGNKVLDKIVALVKDKAVVEAPPKMEGRQLAALLSPAKVVKAK